MSGWVGVTKAKLLNIEREGEVSGFVRVQSWSGNSAAVVASRGRL